MLPPIVNALAAEMVRDGGSFAALFLCADSNEYCLQFGIQLDEHDGYVEASGFSRPVILNRPSQLETQISWRHATALLGQLRPMLRHEQHLRAADVMVDIAEHEGAITVLAKEQYPSLAGPRKVLPRPEAKSPLGLDVSDRTPGVDPSAKLETSLRSVVDVLESHGERNWSFIVAGLLSRLSDGDAGAVDGILALYGGMGSFNDLFLCPQNGHSINEESVKEVNAQLRALASQIWVSAREMQRALDRRN